MLRIEKGNSAIEVTNVEFFTFDHPSVVLETCSQWEDFIEIIVRAKTSGDTIAGATRNVRANRPVLWPPDRCALKETWPVHRDR